MVEIAARTVRSGTVADKACHESMTGDVIRPDCVRTEPIRARSISFVLDRQVFDRIETRFPLSTSVIVTLRSWILARRRLAKEYLKSSHSCSSSSGF